MITVSAGDKTVVVGTFDEAMQAIVDLGLAIDGLRTSYRMFGRWEQGRLRRTGDSWAIDCPRSVLGLRSNVAPWYEVTISFSERHIADYRRWESLSGSRTYVRLGLPPESGRSLNYRDRVLEPGVSAFEAAWDGDTLVIVSNAGVIMMGSRPLYEISGDLVGTGSDDEPCLANVTVIGEVPEGTKVEIIDP